MNVFLHVLIEKYLLNINNTIYYNLMLSTR